MYDAVHLFAKALHDLDTSQQIDIKPLSCESTDTWPHGYSLINYMKIVSISATIWYAKNQSKHRQPKLCRMKIDWTCATNLIFLFCSICSCKKNLALYSHDCSTGKTFKERLLYIRCHVKRVGRENSIGVLILSRYRWKSSNWKRVERWFGETMFASRWRSDGSLWRNWQTREKKKKRKKKWCNGTRKFSG